MPRRAKPARLWLRPAKHGRDAVYIILDRGRQISTGYGPDARSEAERKFREYLGAKHDADRPAHMKADATRVSLMLPADLLAQLDAHVEARGLDRSSFLTKAARHELEAVRARRGEK